MNQPLGYAPTPLPHLCATHSWVGLMYPKRPRTESLQRLLIGGTVTWRFHGVDGPSEAEPLYRFTDIRGGSPNIFGDLSMCKAHIE